jgi:hypothetical protein
MKLEIIVHEELFFFFSKRIVNLGGPTQVIVRNPGSERFICAYCSQVFVVSSLCTWIIHNSLIGRLF